MLTVYIFEEAGVGLGVTLTPLSTGRFVAVDLTIDDCKTLHQSTPAQAQVYLEHLYVR